MAAHQMARPLHCRAVGDRQCLQLEQPRGVPARGPIPVRPPRGRWRRRLP